MLILVLRLLNGDEILRRSKPLKRLCMAPSSGMSRVLSRIQWEPDLRRSAHAITAEVGGRIVAWALNPGDQRWDWGIFVHPDWRRRGIGRLLAKKALRGRGPQRVSAHDAVSRAFWGRFQYQRVVDGKPEWGQWKETVRI